ncbi:erythromycin esterase family protein [Myroides marinus]|uniref:Erythromycin esterase n=1 Tax=Myroides marinus TaxID=703342 RepID=A0A1H6WTC3_9FLAO|nr:erythromycin esterase family protein [Myroides marinus]MDM1348337.1 erythromycin esterase family protein [Myroides marinus]MDM1351832.1 erythromycin esterase family protein [Myroides marinus]MDM1355439.1 erythromycin esterase family protein [Myroides marinus]MDM1359056.1 erythromycin esterase family protein [Myroides marinus]MDM1366370.1 erythromycin esterase family protein [Myroides marinus]
MTIKKTLLGLFLFVATASTAQEKEIIPFTYDIKTNQYKGLTPIINALKDNTIVALGEGTHGTKEFNDIRIELIKDLITNHNFRIIAFENAYGDTYMINQVINSTGDLQKTMKENLVSVWQTKEIENLFSWIRSYNKKTKDKVTLTGVDTNFLNNATSVLLNEKDLVRNKTYYENCLKLSEGAKAIDYNWANSNTPNFEPDYNNLIKVGTEAYQLTKEMTTKYSDKLSTTAKIALYNLELGFRMFYEISQQNETYTRDFMMAETVIKTQSLLNQKMIIIAHNGHIGLTQSLIDPMGEYIKKQYGTKFYSLGTFTANGTYSAMTDNIDVKVSKYSTYELPKVLGNSLEQQMEQYPEKNYFVDFRNTPSSVFDSPKKMNWIGYKKMTEEEQTKYMTIPNVKLRDHFDGFIFMNTTRASEHIN